MLTRALVTAALLVLLSPPADMLACGDKFLVPGRGARFRDRPVNRESAAVLLYAQPGSALDRTLQVESVESRLRKAGYRPTLVKSAQGFESALHGGGWDVVVVDLADAPDIVRRVSSAPAPLVLPVAFGVQRATLDQARQRYRQVLKSPEKDRAFLDAIDSLIAERARTRAKSASRFGG
jgi:hypothetical protein